MRAPILLLAACLALSTLGGAQSRSLKVRGQAALAACPGPPSPRVVLLAGIRATVSFPQPSLQDSCSDGFRSWLASIETCDPGTNPSTCCAPLLGLGTECIGAAFAAVEQSDQQTVQAM